MIVSLFSVLYFILETSILQSHSLLWNSSLSCESLASSNFEVKTSGVALTGGGLTSSSSRTRVLFLKSTALLSRSIAKEGDDTSLIRPVKLS